MERYGYQSPSETDLAHFFEERPNLQRYMNAMDSSLRDKLEKIAVWLTEILQKDKPIILSIGPGTGSLEKAIAELVKRQHGMVVAADLSLPMLEKMKVALKNLLIDEDSRLDIDDDPLELEVLQANAMNLPLAANSVDAIVLSSVVHEVASFGDDYIFGEKVRHFFMSMAEKLKVGGRMVIRDFVQPPNPNQIIELTIGTQQQGDPMDPAQFLAEFALKGQLRNLTVTNQIENLRRSGQLKAGAKIQLPASVAFEILGHFSWSQSFDSEVKEKYAYLPLDQYSEFVLDAFQAAGCQGELISSQSYLQSGYAEHLDGRFRLSCPDGSHYDWPKFTGLMVFTKTT